MTAYEYNNQIFFIAGCILVNSGDLLEIISDGRFPATNHRVSVPQDPKLRGIEILATVVNTN